MRLVKGNEYEFFYWDDDAIYRREDTSEAPNKYYVLSTNGVDGAFYAPRHVKIGDRIEQAFHVQHFWKNGGLRLEGDLGGTLIIREHLDSYTLPNGVAVRDVLHIGYDGGEEYWFARNYSLVGWKNEGFFSRLKTLNGDDGTLSTRDVGYVPRGMYFRPKPITPPVLPPTPDSTYRFDPFRWALYVRAYADGLRPSSAEYDRDGYRYLEVMNADGKQRTYRAEIGKWGSVEIYSDEIEPEPEPPASAEFAFEAWPCPGQFTITQGYGANKEYYAQWGLDGHEGIDIAVPFRSEIVAVAEGLVTRVVDERLPKSQGGHNYGVHVRVKHVHGYETIYAHLDSHAVKAGDIVQAGQRVGLGDSTGNSSGHHLHISLKRDGQFIDITPFLEAVKP
jgi:murein DD-endopeptidase MepM/ murein hydrolase activator NlpD